MNTELYAPSRQLDLPGGRAWYELRPQDYLDPAALATDLDDEESGGARDQYALGLRYGLDAEVVGIDPDGHPFATDRSGITTTFVWRAGEVRDLASFWRGFLDAGCQVVVQRRVEKGADDPIVMDTVIKKARRACRPHGGTYR